MSIAKYGKVAATVIATLLGFFALKVKADTNDQGKTITNETCTGMDTTMIPIGNFSPPILQPEDGLHATQKYNTSYDEGYDFNGSRYFGHDGFDMRGMIHASGTNDVKAILPGIVILSYDVNHSGGPTGWGESIIVATRANPYSDEIITHHYHHMYRDNTGTTRQFNACETVHAGDILGKEDNTGNSHGSHLHFGMRRWKNIDELLDALKKGHHNIYGYGYTFGDNTKIVKNLDPESVLFDTFRDYQLDANGNPPACSWSQPYVLDMRHRGIEFGLFDGRYGAGENVTRRETARWLKIAAQRHNNSHTPPTFVDVSATDSDFPYIETLTTYPSDFPVINKDAGIIGGQRYFYPDDTLTRAAALKMVILTFYSSEFLKVYNDNIWKASYTLGIQLLSKFQDVDPNAWYAPYVYFGAQKGLVAVQQNFYPSNSVKREEMAKWVSEGAALVEYEVAGPCNSVFCPADYFCDWGSGLCFEIPTCVPTETQECAIGGGYTGNEQCTPSQTASCGNCGTETCDANSQWGACLNQGVCTPGQTQQQTCNGSGTETRTCQNSCTWGAWGVCSVNPVCSSGQTQQQSCTTPNNLPGTQTRTCDANGQWGAWGSCIQSCTDVYLASASPACHTAGGYEFCIDVQQVSGSNWQYRVCKYGGLFLSNYQTILHDDNHSWQLGDTYLGNAGDVCFPWRQFSVSYLNGYGPANGAGVRADVLYPANCGQANCTFSTGTVTVRKECQ